ncbi:hypothetical protein BDP27DRAFT_1405515 [Rhodocollybia butyracea]|uniref:NACHT domain-containing protein n=1 Tax=Rhodocollybia butyracea TaxID=206335 RepID=A0A9P5PIJ7_9AGAR|nr:hypothetical protein BDP27DRAFT_1405515 [Rhodocollybia butyracea]
MSSSAESGIPIPKRLQGTEGNVPLSMLSGASNFTIQGSSTFTNVAGDNNMTTNINNYHTREPFDISKIRDWLKAPDPSTNFVAAYNNKTPDTGNWILAHTEYVKWCQREAGILWIQGKVGSGKTFLSTTIINELQANSALLCCYYYFDNRDNSKTNAQGLVQSLLLQMAASSKRIHPALHELYTRCKHGIMKPTIEEIRATLAVVSRDIGPVFLVLDAMDECNEPMSVFKYLAHIRENLCIAITSRYVAEDSYGATMSIYLDSAMNAFHEDITKYLQDKLSYRKLKPELLTELVSCLIEGAQGQFRWVDCQVTILQRCATPKAICETLKKLPKTLEETYTLAFTRMRESEHSHDAEKLLMWLAYAFEPLSITQMTEVLAVDLNAQLFAPDARSSELERMVYYILDSTLITVNGQKIVQLAHNSVKEFLTQTHAQVHRSGQFKIDEHLAHSTICQTCLVYLLQFDQDLPYDFQHGRVAVWALWKDYPLALYAAKQWPSHMKMLKDEVAEISPELEYARDLAMTLLRGSHQLPYVNWIRIYNPDNQSGASSVFTPTFSDGKILTPLYYMALIGLPSIVRLLLAENMSDVNAKGGYYGTALQAAAYSGSKGTVQLLLDHKADLTAQGGAYGSPLHAAAAAGKKDIAELLLEHKADVNAQFQLLLKHKADVNAEEGAYGSPLQAAAAKGNIDLIRLLLEHNADVNAKGVYMAVQLRQPPLKSIHKADVNAGGGVYGSPLQAAAAKGNKDIVQLLLEHNADVDGQEGIYGSAIEAAATKGHNDIVQFLLQHKVDVYVQGSEYEDVCIL